MIGEALWARMAEHQAIERLRERDVLLLTREVHFADGVLVPSLACRVDLRTYAAAISFRKFPA